MKTLNFVLVLFVSAFCSCDNVEQMVVLDSSVNVKNMNLISFDYIALRDSSSADSGLPTTRISRIDANDSIEIIIEHQSNTGPCLDADIEIRNDTIWPRWWDTCPEQRRHSLTIYEMQFMIRDSGINKNKIRVILPD